MVRCVWQTRWKRQIKPSASSWVGKAYKKDGCVWLPYWAWITNSFILANRSLSCWDEHTLFRGARHLKNSSIFGWTWSRNFHSFESLKPRACSSGKMRRCGNSWGKLTWLHFGWSVTSGVSVITQNLRIIIVDGEWQFNSTRMNVPLEWLTWPLNGLPGHGQWCCNDSIKALSRWALTHLIVTCEGRYLVDPASSHMLVSKIKPCMSKYKSLYGETANGSLNQL